MRLFLFHSLKLVGGVLYEVAGASTACGLVSLSSLSEAQIHCQLSSLSQTRISVQRRPLAAKAEPHPHQPTRQPIRQQAQQVSLQLWQQQGTELWAATTAQERVEHLRDNDGNMLPRKTRTAMQRILIANLGKRCNTLAAFFTRHRMAADAEEWLQFALDTGFTITHVHKLLHFTRFSACVNAARVRAHVDQLQFMNGGSKHKALQQLGHNPNLMMFPLDTIVDKAEHIQKICEALPSQVATMVGRDANFLTLSKSRLDISLDGLRGALLPCHLNIQLRQWTHSLIMIIGILCLMGIFPQNRLHWFHNTSAFI